MKEQLELSEVNMTNEEGQKLQRRLSAACKAGLEFREVRNRLVYEGLNRSEANEAWAEIQELGY